jgi:hypothetical protein
MSDDENRPKLPADRDEFERQTKQLARGILDALDRYDDPDVVAAREQRAAARDAHTIATIERFFLETGQRDDGDSLQTSVAKMSAYFAAKLEAAGSLTGELTQPLPRRDTGARVELEVGELPAGDTRHYLQLVLYTPEGKGTTSQFLRRGSPGELIAFLREASAADEIIATVDDLEKHQRQRQMRGRP